MRVGELAGRTGASPRALRYYEERGLLRARRRRNGYREFDEAAVALVTTIRDLVGAGLRIADVCELVGDRRRGMSDEQVRARTLALYRARLRLVTECVQSLRTLEADLLRRIARLEAGLLLGAAPGRAA